MKPFFFFASIFLLTACSGPVTYTKLSNETYAEKLSDSVGVFVDEKPNKEFKRIAIISTNMWKENFATNIELMKRKAAELGADAIILFRAEPHTSGGGLVAAPVSGSFMALGTSVASGYNYSAYAIKYLRN
jgi:hypothetical protein